MQYNETCFPVKWLISFALSKNAKHKKETTHKVGKYNKRYFKNNRNTYIELNKVQEQKYNKKYKMYINKIKTILTDKRLFKFVYNLEYNLERYISMCRRETAVSAWVMHEQIVKKSTVIRQSLGVAQLKIAVVVHPKIMKHIKDWLPTSALCAYMTLFNQNTHLPLIAGYLNPVRYNGLL